VLAVLTHAETERDRKRGRQTNELVDADRRTRERADTLEAVETRVAQIDFLASHLRQIGRRKIGTWERDVLQRSADEVAPNQGTGFESGSQQLREAEVRVVDATVHERHVAQRALCKFYAGRAAVDQRDPMPDHFRAVAPGEIAPDELDVEQSRTGERLSGVTRADHSHAGRFALIEHERVEVGAHPPMLARRVASAPM
jgi:hypothetical protein